MTRAPASLTAFIVALVGWTAFGLALAAGEGVLLPAGAASGVPPGPPPEAVAACKGRTEGANVTFTGRRGEQLTGTCQSVAGVLAARPAFGGPPRR